MKKLFVLILCFTSIITFANDSNYAAKEKDNKEIKMQHSSTQLTKINLVGVKVRTNRSDESNPETGKIFSCVQRYFHEQLFEKISHRKNPGTTYCVYTEYETDCSGAYTYFIGEEVSSLESIPNDLEVLTIPAQSYVKFTTEPGPMPNVVIGAWEAIWQMSSKVLGGTRRYHSDFEIYDERAADHSKVVLDLFIGIE